MRVWAILAVMLLCVISLPAMADTPAATKPAPQAQMQTDNPTAPPLLPVSALPKSSAPKDLHGVLNNITSPDGVSALLGSLGLMITLSGGPQFCAAVLAGLFIVLWAFGVKLVQQKWPRFITLLLLVVLAFALTLSAGVIKMMLACSVTTTSAADCGTAQGFTLVAGVFPLSVLSAMGSFILYGIILGRIKLKRQKPSKS